MIIKDFVENIPFPIGKLLTKVPFKYRLGRSYVDNRNLIQKYNNASEEWKNDYLITSLNKIKNYSQNHFDFYKKLYDEYGVIDLKIKDFSDWNKLPTINKEQLRNNLGTFKGHQIINTGGTSGEPFAFYIDKEAWSREWAHMHYIWELKGYNFKKPKITLRGKDLGDNIFKFNPVHNEFIINTYKDFSERNNAKLVKDLIIKREIKFAHGYPSAIFNFFSEIASALTKGEIDELKNCLKICLLGSEFPIEYMVNYLQKVWDLDFISWYGHSEMCILAYDFNKSNDYSPFMTYGYSEIVENELIGTSYHNFDMPLIRYKTGDLVTGTNSNHNILQSFTIREGRSGDFIIDKLDKKISLTSLIFGRHHKAFNEFDYVQVSQILPGKATILVTNSKSKQIDDLSKYFDFDNVNIDFEFKEIEKPVLTGSGKYKLKV